MQSDIVKVFNPELIQATPNYITYCVRGADKNGSFEFQARFSQFFELRKRLLVEWPACYIPSLPKKLVKGNFDEAVIQERTVFLDFFMNSLIQLEHLWYSPSTQTFIYKKQQFEPLTSIVSQVDNYTDIFHLEHEENLYINIQIDQFQQFIQNATPILKNFKRQVLEFIKTYHKEQEQMNIFSTFYLNQYEQIFVSEYTNSPQKLPFSETYQPNIVIEAEQLSNEYQILLNQIQLDLNEYEGIQETINQQKQYQSKLDQEQMKLKELVVKVQDVQTEKNFIIRKLSQNQTLEETLVSVREQEQKTRSQFIATQVLTRTLAKGISKFKEFRYDSYRETIKKMAQMSIRRSKLNIGFYSKILTHQTLK